MKLKINKLSILIQYIRHGILYYWYTGDKKIAILGGITGSLINITFLSVVSGGSALLLVLLLLFDHLLIIICLMYIIFLRNLALLPTEKIDSFFMENFIYLAIGWIINRVITNLIAEKFFQKELKKEDIRK
ncbi:MAG: hypothetical protein DRG78_06605 [Epsilonproteobacteria bacterium]|nr:MAG: hypothetical protein DRG78_06605 [Campylobacterota bacterium]